MNEKNTFFCFAKRLLLICILCCYLFPGKSNDEISRNNWYVGNTQAGEWIKFNRVWLSTGTYRFTTRAVAIDENQTVHIEINGEPLKMAVPVPSNENDEFELVHLGAVLLQAGSYEIKLVFETGNVNVDMIFIKKGSSTADQVLENDIEFLINNTDGMHIAPIGGPFTSSSSLAKGGGCKRRRSLER